MRVGKSESGGIRGIRGLGVRGLWIRGLGLQESELLKGCKVLCNIHCLYLNNVPIQWYEINLSTRLRCMDNINVCNKG